MKKLNPKLGKKIGDISKEAAIEVGESIPPVELAMQVQEASESGQDNSEK